MFFCEKTYKLKSLLPQVDEEKMAKCLACGKEVPERTLSFRYKECKTCVAEDRASDMTVGDLNTK